MIGFLLIIIALLVAVIVLLMKKACDFTDKYQTIKRNTNKLKSDNYTLKTQNIFISSQLADMEKEMCDWRLRAVELSIQAQKAQQALDNVLANLNNTHDISDTSIEEMGDKQ